MIESLTQAVHLRGRGPAKAAQSAAGLFCGLESEINRITPARRFHFWAVDLTVARPTVEPSPPSTLPKRISRSKTLGSRHRGDPNRRSRCIPWQCVLVGSAVWPVNHANMIAGMFNFKEIEFFEIQDEAVRETPQVSFSRGE